MASKKTTPEAATKAATQTATKAASTKFVLKPDHGSLFRNDSKTDANPTWPDYQGKINIDGQLYYLSGWNVKTSRGNFLSLSIGDKVESNSN